MKKRPFSLRWLVLGLCISVLAGLLSQVGTAVPSTAAAATSTPRINLPRFTGNIPVGERAVFWFGQVNETSNYADVRVGYNETELLVLVSAFDRRLWFDNTPTVPELEQWDAATLYLHTAGPVGSAPAAGSYRFVGMHTSKPSTSNYGVYRGDGGGWTPATTPFAINTGTQASGFNNDDDDRGWWVAFQIPFASLGLGGAPAEGTVWGAALALHDRDDAAGTAIADRLWPAGMDKNAPATWAQFHFGLPEYEPKTAVTGGAVVIRDGENGESVVDAHAGGHSTCGDELWPDRFFSDWGYRNYAGFPQMNIQNQFNLGDWPCFSKYYVTFPLQRVPAGKVIQSATLSMYQFGNAGQTSLPEPQPTLIQVMTVADTWQEATINWNNGPQVLENVSSAWAGTIPAGGDGFFVEWDVSRAVAQAMEAGAPLRLALYTADGNRNSGKYFVTSEGARTQPQRRPTLTVVWGEAGLSVSPAVQVIAPGGAATYLIGVDAFSDPVTLSATSPSSDLVVALSPEMVSAPQQATLTVTDALAADGPPRWYTIPIEGVVNGETVETAVTLLVGGQQLFLPLVNR